ncbi:MAG TPA: Hsp20/alpha crystallin family protein [Gemmatimonadaceae bacterium]|nr:Hsp20/alpha crystallin family protein [Gemmatimonadaceae bacterium]
METQTTPATTERSSNIPVEREVSVPAQQPPTSVSPFALMRAMMDDMGKMRMATLDALWLPAIDVSKRDDQLVVRAELPGFNAKDVNVEVEGGTLTISGERQQSTSDAYHSERSYGSFYRAIPLPENVDPDQIKATFTNGVLEVTMSAPKAEQQARKKIEVK